MKKSLLLLAVLGLLLTPAFALADSISPASIDFIGLAGELSVFEFKKTVTITEKPTSALVDVFYLADTTGSMDGQIANVKASATALVGSIAGLGDVRQGAGEYRDIFDAFAYRTNQALTATPANNALVTAGIGAWVADGGDDIPEANLYALYQVATTESWRAGAQKLIVQFGDAPGHDPRLGITEAMATAAMVAEGIKLLAIDVGAKDSTGQETRMTAATGGILTKETNPTKLAETIEALIVESFETYSTVKLGIKLDAGEDLYFSSTPVYVGEYDRSIDRTFEFDVTLVGCCDALKKSFEFEIFALVDDVIVATEYDTWNCPAVPLPNSLLFLGTGLIGLLGLRRRS